VFLGDVAQLTVNVEKLLAMHSFVLVTQADVSRAFSHSVRVYM